MATNSTPWTSASTMRLTALTPAPPTPTTRITGVPATLAPQARLVAAVGAAGVGVGAGARAGARAGSAARGVAAVGQDVVGQLGAERVAQALLAACGDRSRARIGTQRGRAGLARARRRVRGPSRGRARAVRGAAAGRRHVPRLRSGDGAAGAAAGVAFASGALVGGAPSAPSARLRRSCGTAPPAGPPACSRAYRWPLARTSCREIAIGLGGHPVRVVLQDRHALHGRLGEADRLLDPRREDAVAEVLLEDLDRLLGVDGARVHQRRQDALDLDVRD